MASEVGVREAVVFGTGGGIDLLCDVYTPPTPADGPRAAVLLLHGGAWRGGDRSIMRGLGANLARDGFVGVASQYRLNPAHAWPAHIHDVKAALRWMRANAAELGIDTEKIAVLGRSAGAHLALLAAGTPGLPEFEGAGGNPGYSTAVAAAVGVYTPTAFFVGEQRTHGGTPARSLILEGATEESARAASPTTYAVEGYPPTFLLHGSDDRVVPASASTVMYDALVAAKVPVEMHMYAQQPHAFLSRPDFLALCSAEISHFLHRYLNAREEQGKQPERRRLATGA